MSALTPALPPQAYNLTVTKDEIAGTLTLTGTPSWPYYGKKTFRACGYSGAYSAGLKGKFFVVSTSPNISNVTYSGIGSDDYLVMQLTTSDVADVSIVVKPVLYSGSTAPTSWSPYSNECPISGWTGMNVQGTGKNLWKFAQSYNPVQYTILLNRVPFELLPGTYTFSAIPNIDTDSIVLFGYHEDGTRTEIARLLSSTTKSSKTTTITKKVVSLLFVSNAGGTITDIQLELGSTATAYEPYQGSSLSINWQDSAGTVYGGNLTVNEDGTGKLTVGWAIKDLGTLNYTYDATSKRFATQGNVIPIKIIPYSTSLSTMICSQYKTVSGQDQYDDLTLNATISQGGGSSAVIRIRDLAYTDAAIFKTAMSGVQLVYELAEPIVYNLTAEQTGGILRSLYGQNNIWHDANGNTTVEYRADTKLYLEKLTAPTEDDLIADHAITSGLFFMIGNTLYRATASIANGATITPGTNATRLSLADALNLLS